jgi:tRNA1(Val) A37 N6-methylase TrmN6
VNEPTSDRFLDGRIIARQSAESFRSGLDAVMLAAAVPAAAEDDALELGSGAGVASLCLGARCSSVRITGLELLPDLVMLANENAHANGMDGRVRFIAGDALAPPSELRRDFNHVFANPPFHDHEGARSPNSDRAAALGDEGRLGEWLLSGLRRVRSQGTFTIILRADRLGEALGHLPERGIVVLPLWPRSDAPAKRVIVQVRKDSRVPFALLPGLVLHESDGRYTAAADAILRGGGSLALGSRAL